ncbi:OmpA family protein [Bacteroidota bacterium]
MKAKTAFQLFLLVLLAFSLSAQDATKSDNVKKTGKSANAVKGSWTMGVYGGVPIIFGDVNPEYFAYGYGISIKKSLSHSFEIRTQFSRGSAFGVDRKYATQNMIQSNPALNGKNNSLVDFTAAGGYTYYNYKTSFYEGSLQFLYNFSFNDFRLKETPRANCYFFFGAGGLMFKVANDQINSSGSLYDFSTVYSDYTAGTITQNEAQKLVIDLLDRDYETIADAMPDGNGFIPDPVYFGHIVLAGVNTGVGVRFKLSSRMDLALESKATFTNNDLLDGQRWDRQSGDLSAYNDIFFFTTIGLNFRLGPLNNVYWFDNPSAMQYKVTLDNKRKISLLSSDVDNDGVSDYFDKDLETPEGVKVDANGMALDSDNDRIPDYLDKEPFSDPDAIVNEEGISQDSDGDGVPDHKDLDANTPKEMLVNFQGVPIGERGSRSGIGGTSLGFLPAIFFNFDDASIRTEFLSPISTVAAAMKYNPNQKLRVIGYTDQVGTPEYNQELGLRRAQAVVNILTMQGIAADRFEIVSKGSTEPLTDVTTSDANRLNRRVQFEIIKDTAPAAVEEAPVTPTEEFEEVPVEFEEE